MGHAPPLPPKKGRKDYQIFFNLCFFYKKKNCLLQFEKKERKEAIGYKGQYLTYERIKESQ